MVKAVTRYIYLYLGQLIKVNRIWIDIIIDKFQYFMYCNVFFQ